MQNTIRSLRQKLIALPKRFAKDPRAKNLGGFAIVGLLAVIVWASAQTNTNTVVDTNPPVARIVPYCQSPFVPIATWAPPAEYKPIKKGAVPTVTKETTITNIAQLVKDPLPIGGDKNTQQIVRKITYATNKQYEPYTGTPEEWLNTHNILLPDSVVFRHNGYEINLHTSFELIAINGKQYVIASEYRRGGKGMEIDEKVYPISDPIKIEEVGKVTNERGGGTIRISGNGNQYSFRYCSNSMYREIYPKADLLTSD